MEKSTGPTPLPHYSSGPSWKAFCTFRGCPSKIELQAPMATHCGVALFFLPDISPPASWGHPTNELPVHNCLSHTLFFSFFGGGSGGGGGALGRPKLSKHHGVLCSAGKPPMRCVQGSMDGWEKQSAEWGEGRRREQIRYSRPYNPRM